MHVIALYQTSVCHHWKRHCQVLQIRWGIHLKQINELTMIVRTLSAVGTCTSIRTGVKQLLFRRLKFFNRTKHGGYDLRPNSVCGIVIATCNVQPKDATPTWWADIRTSIVRTHTDHRNKQCD
jgi:hypothetical protein